MLNFPIPLGASWLAHAYDYDDPAQPGKPHAVKSVDRPGSDSTALTYDANGNTTCRVEVLNSNTTTWLYVYNVENRLAEIRNVSGSCASPGLKTADNANWTMTYDGDGMRVSKDYYDGSTNVKTLYFVGGMYEVSDPTGANTITRYYFIAGQRVAMYDGTDLEYMLTDAQGSVVAVLDK